MATGIQEDLPEWSRAFRSWPKQPALFELYLVRQISGEIDLIVARVGGFLAGYCVIEWSSTYPPFVQAGVPEIADLNVIKRFRGFGAGRALMDEAESRIAVKSATAGIRVGLHRDYDRAQQMYVRRGYVPDGPGVSIDGQSVFPGTAIILDDDPVMSMVLDLSARRA